MGERRKERIKPLMKQSLVYIGQQAKYKQIKNSFYFNKSTPTDLYLKIEQPLFQITN
jgi:hypothetical protein